jgi:hypothetical protein
MLQGPVGKPFTAVVVDQNHEGDRQSSNYIEENEALRRLRHHLLCALSAIGKSLPYRLFENSSHALPAKVPADDSPTCTAIRLRRSLLDSISALRRGTQMLLIESVNLRSVSAAHRQAIYRFADAIASGL